MATNRGAPADSTLAHDVVSEDGVTVSGRQHPLLRIGPSRVTVTRGCPVPTLTELTMSQPVFRVYEGLRLEIRFSHRCTDDCELNNMSLAARRVARFQSMGR